MATPRERAYAQLLLWAAELERLDHLPRAADPVEGAELRATDVQVSHVRIFTPIADPVPLGATRSYLPVEDDVSTMG